MNKLTYLKVDDDIYIEFDAKTRHAVCLSKKEEAKRLEGVLSRIEGIPKLPSDEELLQWARENYLPMNYDVEAKYLQERKDEIETKIAEIEKIK